MKLDIAFSAKQSLFDRAVNDYPYTLYGGAKGGGKSHGLRLIMLKRRLQQAGSVGYIFRKTYAELERNHISPLFEQFPDLRQFYRHGDHTLKLPNRSELRFAFVEHQKDLTKFQGLDAHDVAIEEAGEWLYQHFEYLDTQRRTAKRGVSTRMLLTGNPGGIGHAFLKRLFITRRYEKGEDPANYKFIKALVEDNPFLMKNDPNYVKRLEAIKNEMLRRAFRYGDWDISAGQFYSELSRETHITPKEFKYPEHWKYFGSYDYGFGHPACWHVFRTDEDGNIYLQEEIAQARLRIDEQAALVKALAGFKHVDAWWAGRDCWSSRHNASSQSKGGQPPTIAEDFDSHGVTLKPANTDRKQGASFIRTLLAVHDHTGKKIGPRFFISENCPVTIDCLTRMVHDPDDIEDVLKVDADNGDPWTGDDPYDCVRYGLMSRHSATEKPRKKKSTSYDDEEGLSQVTWQTV